MSSSSQLEPGQLDAEAGVITMKPRLLHREEGCRFLELLPYLRPSYFIYDLPKNLMPHLGPDPTVPCLKAVFICFYNVGLVSLKSILNSRLEYQNRYSISDQNGLTFIPFGAAHTYITHIREYSPGGAPTPPLVEHVLNQATIALNNSSGTKVIQVQFRRNWSKCAPFLRRKWLRTRTVESSKTEPHKRHIPV